MADNRNNPKKQTPGQGGQNPNRQPGQGERDQGTDRDKGRNQ